MDNPHRPATKQDFAKAGRQIQFALIGLGTISVIGTIILCMVA